jgi:uncharacterized protein YidB (DUF937 family)
MGLLDQVVSKVAGNAGADGPSGLSSMLLAVLLGSSHGAGLNALRGRFAENGLGHVIESWIDSGANQPIWQQLQNVLGEEQVQKVSAQTGMASDNLLSLLAQHLPTIIDRLTPQGQVPPASMAEPSVGQP